MADSNTPIVGPRLLAAVKYGFLRLQGRFISTQPPQKNARVMKLSFETLFYWTFLGVVCQFVWGSRRYYPEWNSPPNSFQAASIRASAIRAILRHELTSRNDHFCAN
jgi:hypothetical protein